jgi:MinD superfamily P-loop ATPase
MKIVIASGKGGTGKTMVTASLAALWDRPVIAVDLDVEEPNLDLFLKPQIIESRKAYLEIPEVDESQCTYCRECADLCQYKAITVLGSVIMVFPEMCHGCGGCMAVCPEGAIASGQRVLGEIETGHAGDIGYMMGRLRVGEAMSPPLIRQVQEEVAQTPHFDPAADVLFDAPPGVSCPAVNAAMDGDVIVLVTEPTPFGLFDLRLAHQAFTPLGKPMGVVVNRAGLGEKEIYPFCQGEALPILAEIPYDRRIAEVYARGGVISREVPGLKQGFTSLIQAIRALAESGKEAHHA